MEDVIRLAHGGGGMLSRDLVRNVFLKRFRSPILQRLEDAAVLPTVAGAWALTTDSYVVTPPFFPGGDIGRLAVCGTVNDLAVVGAKPLYLSCGFMLEEGLPLETLERVVDSMQAAAEEAGVALVTGDTKVVEKGQMDRIFITTAGVGEVFYPGLGAEQVQAGDAVLLSGTLGDHALAVLKARGQFPFEYEVQSDAAPLVGLIKDLLAACSAVRFMRDLTRGGLAAAVCELVEGQGWGVELQEQAIPLHPPVMGLCELLGYDPLVLANEGKIVAVVAADQEDRALAALRAHQYGQDAAIIGHIVREHPGKVAMLTSTRGWRIIELPYGEILPRIC